MNIAQIAPLCEAVPPRLYGGTERVVSHLTEALVAQGHQVTLFAAGESRTSARLVAARSRPLRLDKSGLVSDLASHLALLHEVRLHSDEFDVLHFHTDMLHFPLFEHVASRTLTTLHGRLDIADLRQVYARWPMFPLVSISDRQRIHLPGVNWYETVHHGLSPEGFRFNARGDGGYLAFLGRISPEKRPDRAIEIAKASGIPIRLAAKVDQVDRDYFEQRIRPMLDPPLVSFIGEICDDQKGGFLGNALALVFPIDWPEPFGLVMIEAMACGTPVVAFRCGSVPEIVEDGETGFLVDTLEQAVAAASRAHLLDREAIRAHFELRFSATAMARRYLDVYGDLLARRPFAEEPLPEVVTPLRPAEDRSFAASA